MPEFQERLEYIDERYEHLRKHIKNLKSKMQIVETQGILKHDNDEENEKLIEEIIETIKKEKQMLKDEAALIRGELTQATYKEEGRLCMSGDKRRAEQEAAARERWLAEREERLKREAEERERRRQEHLRELEAQQEEQKRRAVIDESRAAAMERLKNLHLYPDSLPSSSTVGSPESPPPMQTVCVLSDLELLNNGNIPPPPPPRQKLSIWQRLFCYRGSASSHSIASLKNGTTHTNGNSMTKNEMKPRPTGV